MSSRVCSYLTVKFTYCVSRTSWVSHDYDLWCNNYNQLWAARLHIESITWWCWGRLPIYKLNIRHRAHWLYMRKLHQVKVACSSGRQPEEWHTAPNCPRCNSCMLSVQHRATQKRGGACEHVWCCFTCRVPLAHVTCGCLGIYLSWSAKQQGDHTIASKLYCSPACIALCTGDGGTACCDRVRPTQS